MADAGTTESNAHRHPNYVAIWVALVILLAISVAVGFMGHKLLATFMIFGIAAIKAGLVIANFMHLRFEPRWIAIIMAGALLIVVVLFFGLFPDIVRVYGK